MSQQEVVRSPQFSSATGQLEKTSPTPMPKPIVSRPRREVSDPGKYYVAGVLFLVIGIFVAGILFGLLTFDMGRKASDNGGDFGGWLQFAGVVEILFTLVGIATFMTT